MIQNSIPCGTFAPPGLCSGNAEESKAFYCQFFGWNAIDEMMESCTATSFKIRESFAAGMYEMGDDRKAAGVRPHWNSYITVENLETVMAKVERAGGKILKSPFGTGDGLVANLEDPLGAHFSVFQVTAASGSAIVAETGALTWSEVWTPEPQKTLAFYSEVFGWSGHPFDDAKFPYHLLAGGTDNRLMAGLLPLTGDMKAVPSQWVPYFMVPDRDEAAKRARQRGAQVENVMDIPKAGRIAIIKDPQGARFAVIEVPM